MIKFFNIQNGAGAENPNIVDFFIMAGQSNCGRTRVSGGSGGQFMDSGQAAVYNKEYTGVKIYNPAASMSDWANMNPASNTYLNTPGEFGAELGFFNEFSDSKIRYLLKYGVGNTQLATNWNAVPNAYNGSVGTLWNILKNSIAESLTAMGNAGKTANFKAFIWVQGENDATNLGWANDYETHLGQFFDEFDAWMENLAVVYDMIFSASGYLKLIGENNGQFDGSQVYNTTVRAKQASFCSVPANNAVLIDTDSFTFYDGVHYDVASQISFGQAMHAEFTA